MKRWNPDRLILDLRAARRRPWGREGAWHAATTSLTLRLLLATLLVGCLAVQATVRYEPSDATVRSPQTTRWTFDTELLGATPRGATTVTGTWTVQADPAAPSPPNQLCQSGAGPLSLLVLEDTVYKDVAMSARIAPLAAAQQAGVVFYVQDRDNYYVVRIEAENGTVTLLKYAAGRPVQLASGGVTLPSGQWLHLRVEAGEQPGQGMVIRGQLNGRTVFQTSDATFKAGKVGLSTRGPSTTCFDDVEAQAR